MSQFLRDLGGEISRILLKGQDHRRDSLVAELRSTQAEHEARAASRLYTKEAQM